MIKINNEEELLKEAKSIINKDAESEFQHKVEIITLVLKGFAPRELEKKKIISRPTLKMWLKNIEESGNLEVLNGVPSLGRPKKLDNKEFDTLKAALKCNPSDYGYSSWDGKSIQDYIKVHFNEDICLRHCQRIKHDLLKKN